MKNEKCEISSLFDIYKLSHFSLIKAPVFLVMAVLLIFTLACSVNLDLISPNKAVQTAEEPIEIPVLIDASPRPGKVTRVRFQLLEAFLKPEIAASLKESTVATKAEAGLQFFFSGQFPVATLEELKAEIQKKFSVDFLRSIKHGTFLLTWEKEDAQLPEKAISASPESVNQEGNFYDDDEAYDYPQTSFFTPEGQQHGVTLLNPNPEKPPALKLQLKIFSSASPSGKEPGIGQQRPVIIEFSGIIDFPEKGFQVIGLLASGDTAYFCCFQPDLVCQDANLTPFRAQLIRRVDPIYPEEARIKNLSGTVKLEFRTNLDGYVSDIRLLEAPNPILTKAAIKAVESWVFKLPEFEGKKYPVKRIVTITFKKR
ncbi:MAG: energy transducer TonB [Candidatus Aminicenantes bacterium]|nr:energy transducer TonB [Candidatus Aminicenantes bacterium]